MTAPVSAERVTVPCIGCGLPVSPGACAGAPLVYHTKPEHCRDALKSALDSEWAAHEAADREMANVVSLRDQHDAASARAEKAEAAMEAIIREVTGGPIDDRDLCVRVREGVNELAAKVARHRSTGDSRAEKAEAALERVADVIDAWTAGAEQKPETVLEAVHRALEAKT